MFSLRYRVIFLQQPEAAFLDFLKIFGGTESNLQLTFSP